MPAPTPVRTLIKREGREHGAYNAITERYELLETFQRRPVLASDLDPATINQAAVRLLTGANKDFIISGTNAANAGSALHVNGGVKLDTGGLDNDQIILSPATAINSVDQTAWRTVEWEPEHELDFETIFELPSLDNILLHVGLGLTAALDLTTDADQAKVQFSTEGSTSTSNFTAATSVGGADAEEDLGVAPTADKSIRIRITTDPNGVPRFYVNNVLKHTGSALTSGVNLIPFMGVQALTGSVKSFIPRMLRLSRKLVATT